MQEAFTCEKFKKGYDNCILEFLGDGVVSIFLAWHLILNNPGSKDVEVDGLRIENSSSKSLYKISVDESKNINLYNNIDHELYDKDFVVNNISHPTHKILEYFCPPFIKSSNYYSIHFFERNEDKIAEISSKIKNQEEEKKYADFEVKESEGSFEDEGDEQQFEILEDEEKAKKSPRDYVTFILNTHSLYYHTEGK
jgi:hypothetical protein